MTRIRIAHNSTARRVAVGLAAVLLYSCQGDSSDPPQGIEGTGGTSPPSSYTVGGSVSGLTGSGLVLQDNGGNDLAIAKNGNFVFTTPVDSGSTYTVTIKAQPANPTQSCVLTGGNGTITNANVSNVAVTCTTSQFTVGGSVGGLIGSGLVLQDNSGNDLAIAANGSFVFSAAVASGSGYAVTIKTQPTNPAQICLSATASGTVGAANVTNVVVTCTIQPGRFAYVSGDAIYCYAVNAVTGALTALTGSPCAHGVRPGVAVDPSGRFAYATLDATNEVGGYTIDSSTGNLTPISGSQLNGGGSNPVDITVDPSGQFVYMANYGGGISAFKINSVTGGLTTISGSPFGNTPCGCVPEVISVTVDPTGKFVYAVIQAENAVSAFAINPSTGALTIVAGSPFPAGSFPTTVRVDPSGKYAYVANGGPSSNNVSAYLINGSTGALTPVPGSPFPVEVGYPTGLVVDPSGRFVYVTMTSNAVSALSINKSTGALTPISGSPFATGAGPWGAFVHPSGKFLYVSNDADGTISGYTIDSTSGALTPISGSPFVACGNGTCSTYDIAISN